MLSQKKFDRIFEHYQKYFGGGCAHFHRLVHGNAVSDIIVVQFEATEAFPYQTLATIGASEHLVQGEGVQPHRCEFVTFIPSGWSMAEQQHAWILEMLHSVSMQSMNRRNPLTYGRSLNMEEQLRHLQGPDFNMIGATLVLPEAVPDPSILHCQTGLTSDILILQMMPITKDELEWHRTNENPYCFDRYFYPRHSNEIRFLCARKR